MTDTEPNRFRRVLTHLRDNADIYVPALIFTASVTTLVILGVKWTQAAREYEQEIADALAEAGEGSRVLFDPQTDNYVIFTPISQEN